MMAKAKTLTKKTKKIKPTPATPVTSKTTKVTKKIEQEKPKKEEIKKVISDSIEIEEIPDVSTLSPGDYLNYKKLCAALKVSVKEGNSKKSQTDDWKRYFDYEKIGTKYLIHEIYDVPYDKEYKYPPNTIYTKYIETLLLSLLGSTEGNVVKISPLSLYRTLGMVNPRFTIMNKLDPEYRAEELQKYTHTEMTEFEVDHFFNRCKSKFSKVIKNAFNSLQRRMLIKYSEEYEYQIYEYDEHDKSYLVTYVADQDEIEYILKVKRQTLLEFECEDEVQIYLKNLTLPYYNEVNRKVRRDKGWVSLYKIYVINYNKEMSQRAFKTDQVQLQKYGLNEALIKYIDEQAVRNYERDTFQYPTEYVSTQHKLSQHLLSIKN